jgi:hypothetical protein
MAAGFQAIISAASTLIGCFFISANSGQAIMAA